VFSLWQSPRDLGKSPPADLQPIVASYLHDRESLAAITCKELKRRLDEGGVIALDVRPEQEYKAGHIAKARSIPVAELKSRLKDLPKGKQIVAYCRGPYCVYADEAVEILRANGRKAVRLESGFPDWKCEGLPVDSLMPRS